MMEINDDVSSRPSIGFPLGLALLLLMLLCMSGLFSCCIHWDKLRSLLFHSSSSSSQHHLDDDIEADIGSVHAQMKAKQHDEEKEEGVDEKMVPVVLMPGDEFPKFIAMACPCHPPLWENLVVIQLHKPITSHVMSSS